MNRHAGIPHHGLCRCLKLDAHNAHNSQQTHPPDAQKAADKCGMLGAAQPALFTSRSQGTMHVHQHGTKAPLDW